MMNRLWNRIDQLKIAAEGKFRLFRTALEIPAGVVGLLVWLVIRTCCLRTCDWMLCFVG